MIIVVFKKSCTAHPERECHENFLARGRAVSRPAWQWRRLNCECASAFTRIALPDSRREWCAGFASVARQPRARRSWLVAVISKSIVPGPYAAAPYRTGRTLLARYPVGRSTLMFTPTTN